MPPGTNYGVMRPLGGGDPSPLLKTDLVIGRRPSCDIRLDFNNVSGQHCELRLIHGVWHVRDRGSTNGTTINGQLLTSDHSLMPDDELGIASHFYQIDYEPSGPEAVVSTKGVFDEEVVEERGCHSLMKLAGLDTDKDKPEQRHRPRRAPAAIERLSADEADFEDVLSEHVKAAPLPKVDASDEDFLKLIEDLVEKPEQ